MEFDREIIVGAFKRDEQYTKMGKTYFNTETHEVYWQDTDGISGKNTEPPEGENWIEVKPPSHGEWHEVFQEWLEKIGKPDAYTTSIGLTLKNLEEDVPHIRQGWDTYQREYAEQKNRRTC